MLDQRVLDRLGGERVHVSHVLRVMAGQGLQTVDMENLRPHYARTLWCWSDALEAQQEAARRVADERTPRGAQSAYPFNRQYVYTAG